MKIYEITLPTQKHYVLAADFEDAHKQALKLLATEKHADWEDYWRIIGISEQFELEVVK